MSARTVNLGFLVDFFFVAVAGLGSPSPSPPTSVGLCGTPASPYGRCGIHSSLGAVQSFDQWPVLPHLKHAREAPFPAGARGGAGVVAASDIAPGVRGVRGASRGSRVRASDGAGGAV